MSLLALSSTARAAILQNLLQLLQNPTAPVTNVGNVSVDLPGVNIDLPIPGIGSSPSPTTPTLRSYLLTLLNEQVQISTSFDSLEGTLIAVQSDYVVLVQGDGSLVFVPISQIETVTEL